MTFYPPGPETLVEVMRSKGYRVVDGPGGYDLNLYGVRTADNTSNRFNDWVGLFYRNDGVWNHFAFPATTDPGLYWRHHPMNVAGTAILKPGQYLGAWTIGLHRGSYTALVQRAPVTVYRDADRDDYLEVDEGKAQSGLFGINIHRASATRASTRVDKWSAGCQVVADPLHFDFLMALARKAAEQLGPSFSYTLLTESDFQLI